MNIINSAYLFVLPAALIIFLKARNKEMFKRNICIKILSLTILLSASVVYSQWTPQASPSANNLVSVHFINSTTGYIAGEQGTILKTTNGGVNWVQQTSPVSSALISCIFTDVSTGWMSGTFGTVIKTTNGGTNWISLTTGVSGALRIHFVNTFTGWVAGANGTILKTTDGGTNWIAQISGSSSFLLKIFFTDLNSGWACGAGGTILSTTNGGTNWNTQVSGTSQNLFGIHFVNSLTGCIVGAGGNIRSTTNGGTNWTSQTAGATDDFYSVYFANQNVGWLSGDNGKIYYTYNGGANWVQQTSSTTELLNGVFFTSVQTGWSVGTNGKILSTTTGGVTIPTAPSLSSPGNNSTGISVTPTLQWFSVLGAQTYQLIISTDSLFNTAIVNDSTLTTTGYTVAGGLLQNNIKYFWRVRAKGTGGYGPYSSRWNFTTGMVSIQPVSNEIPAGFELYNNYPNPFNPETSIRFDIPKSSFVMLSVFDINGREIKQLVNRELLQGKYTVSFNASGISSGVYFYRITAGDFTDIKKMMLVK